VNKDKLILLIAAASMIASCDRLGGHYIVWSVWTSGTAKAQSTFTTLEKCKGSADDLNVIAVRQDQPYRYVCVPEGTNPIVGSPPLTPGKTYRIKADGTPEEVKVVDFKDLK
jgi:hypothetical protein